MIEIAQKTLDYYFDHFLRPTPAQIGINENPSPQSGSVFVTIYSGGNVRGSAGNIKAIEKDIRIETLNNTMQALTGDDRFERVGSKEKGDIKLRVDTIIEHKVITEEQFLKLDPSKNGTIVISRDYTKLAVILPNISPKLINGEDFIDALSKKLGVEFIPKDYYLYKISTKMETNF